MLPGLSLLQRGAQGAGAGGARPGHRRRQHSTHALAISHLGAKGYRVYLEIYGGGFGGGPRRDGCDAVDSPLSNCTNTPVEATDMDFEHFRVIGYGLLPDTGGPGKSGADSVFFAASSS